MSSPHVGEVEPQAGVVLFCCLFVLFVISACDWCVEGGGRRYSLGWHWLHPRAREAGKHLSQVRVEGSSRRWAAATFGKSLLDISAYENIRNLNLVCFLLLFLLGSVFLWIEQHGSKSSDS